MTPALKSYEEIIKDVRMKHSIVGNKHGRIVKPVHRTEFYRVYRTKGFILQVKENLKMLSLNIMRESTIRK